MTGLLVEATSLKFGGVLAFLLQCLNLLLLLAHLGIDLDVKFEKMVDRVLAELLFVSIALVCQSEKAILLSPVSQVYVCLGQTRLGNQ